MSDRPPSRSLRIALLVAIFLCLVGWEVAEAELVRSDSNAGYVAPRATAVRAPAPDVPSSPAALPVPSIVDVSAAERPHRTDFCLPIPRAAAPSRAERARGPPIRRG